MDAYTTYYNLACFLALHTLKQKAGSSVMNMDFAGILR